MTPSTRGVNRSNGDCTTSEKQSFIREVGEAFKRIIHASGNKGVVADCHHNFSSCRNYARDEMLYHKKSLFSGKRKHRSRHILYNLRITDHKDLMDSHGRSFSLAMKAALLLLAEGQTLFVYDGDVGSDGLAQQVVRDNALSSGWGLHHALRQNCRNVVHKPTCSHVVHMIRESTAEQVLIRLGSEYKKHAFVLSNKEIRLIKMRLQQDARDDNDKLLPLICGANLPADLVRFIRDETIDHSLDCFRNALKAFWDIE